MAQEKTGVLPMQTLKRLFQSGHIGGVDDRYINPASVDLPLSDEAYRLESTFLTLDGEKVRDIIPLVGGTKHDLRSPLEVGVSYLVKIAGAYELPANVYGYVNPKSSTGRTNLFCRVVADRVPLYDALITEGFTGEVWVLIRADSFPVLLSPGQAVSQLRLFNGKTFLDPLELNLAIKEHGLLFHPQSGKIGEQNVRRHADSLLLTLRVAPGETGFECRGSGRVLDFSKLNHYNPLDFFSPIRVDSDRMTLRKGDFYILTTDERVMVPPSLSAELRAIDPRFGEFRSHAAGYIDPGWGYGKDGSACGRPITLEVTPHETMMVRHGQIIARIRYEAMKEVPDVSYDEAASNYTIQEGPKLSKHFKKI